MIPSRRMPWYKRIIWRQEWLLNRLPNRWRLPLLAWIVVDRSPLTEEEIRWAQEVAKRL